MKNNIYFGITVNLIVFLIVYIMSAFYIWDIYTARKGNAFIFIMLYIIVILLLKFIITKIYLILTNVSKLEEFENKFYNINNRPNWGGIFKCVAPYNKNLLVDACNDSLKSLRNMPKDSEIQKRINELEQDLKELKSDVITGGSVFEVLFCFKKML